MKKGFKKIAYVFCFIVIIVSVVHVIRYYENQIRHHENQIYNKKVIERLQKEKEEEATKNQNKDFNNGGTQRKEKTQRKQDKILKEYRKLYKENNDMYGWIKIDGTGVNYPVMFTPKDPNFYENKNWEKQVCYNNVGSSIFIDGRTTSNCNNIIVYGHNMRNGSMFGSLKEYKEKDFYKDHKFIEFDTLYKKQKYEIISVSKAVVYYEEQPPEGEYLFYMNLKLNSKNEFDNYINNIKQNAYYKIDKDAEYGDSLITLCTCDYWTENARLLIVAKKIKE